MILASGSTSDTDGGIIVQNAAGAGYALGYDSGVDRWAFDADLAHNATNLVPDAYVGVVQVGTTHGDWFYKASGATDFVKLADHSTQEVDTDAVALEVISATNALFLEKTATGISPT